MFFLSLGQHWVENNFELDTTINTLKEWELRVLNFKPFYRFLKATKTLFNKPSKFIQSKRFFDSKNVYKIFFPLFVNYTTTTVLCFPV